MKFEELIIPQFVLAEIPVKDGSIHDDRSWIYCPGALSLIEVIAEDELTVALDRSLIRKKFTYENPDCFPEYFLLVIIQNNCEYAGVDPQLLLDQAWNWYQKYLIWEDSAIDQSEKAIDN